MFELLIVLAIMAVLVIIAAPSLISYYQQNRLVGTTEDLYYTLQFAKSAAVKQNTTAYVSFQTGDNWCYGVNLGTTCNCALANSCTLGSTKAARTQTLTLSSNGISGGSLHFEPNHGAANVNGTLTFTEYGQSTSMTIKISLLGSLLTCSSQVPGYPSCT